MVREWSTVAGFVFVVVLGTAIVVAADAATIGAKRGLVSGLADMGPGGWFLACLLVWIVATPLYLVKRRELKAAVEAERARSGQRG